MNDINNQKDYWNAVANAKTFTHPLDLHLIKTILNKQANILDYGCGYGRLTVQLYDEGFKNTIGVDTSAALVKRGRTNFPQLDLLAIENPKAIPVEPNSMDMILLFAVLTCIPSNTGQQELIKILHDTLKPGGLLYISDYYLQQSKAEVNRYEYFENNRDNYGVFTFAEGVTFRHHTKDYIQKLLSTFEPVIEKQVEVRTMNGHVAEAFQIVVSKKD